MTRAVLLDFFGTLVRPVAGAPRYRDVFAAFGYDADAAVLQAFYDHPDFVDHREHSASEAHYRAWTRSRLELLCRTLGVAEHDVAAVADGLEEANTYAVEPYPEVVEVLSALAASGVSLAICSNWGWHLDPLIEQAGLSGLVDVAVTSARVGVRKPHADIYHHTLDRLGAEATDVLFVGDTWLADVEGPLRAGLPRAAHIERGDGIASPSCGPRDRRPGGVRCLPDLRGVLELAGW